MKLSQKEYTLIKKNIFIDRKKYQITDDDTYICQCEKPIQKKKNNKYVLIKLNNVNFSIIPEESFGCYGKECINQFISTECIVKLCHAGKLCRNRRFQLHHYSEVYPKRTEERVCILYNMII